LIGILSVIAPDGDLMMGDLLKARQRANGVQIVVEDRYIHGEGWTIREYAAGRPLFRKAHEAQSHKEASVPVGVVDAAHEGRVNRQPAS